MHTYAYDAANRLTGMDGVSYTWDARGNLRSNGVFTYTYDGAGHRVRAESVSATVVYTYGLDSLLVGRSAGGAATTYAWDWATGVPEMLSDGERLYLVGQETLGWADGAEWSYPLGDALGSVRQVVDGAGEVLDDRSWTPFGVEEGTAQGGLGYTGEWWDAEVSLLYLRARWYDPTAGRFTQRDPWEGELMEPQTRLRGYVYVLNEPVNGTDPSGAVYYDRAGAAEYAIDWATKINEEYGDFGGSDCTNFVSQALREGGFPEDDEWFFEFPVRGARGCTGARQSQITQSFFACLVVNRYLSSRCGSAWTLTDKLFNYLKEKGFAMSRYSGTQQPTGLNADGEVVVPAVEGLVLPWAFDWDAKGQARTESLYLSSSTREGDVVFYKQRHTPHVSDGGEFNHAAFVVGWGELTRGGQTPPPGSVVGSFVDRQTPHIVDHSSPFSDLGRRAINDTFTEVNELVIVHIPDDIPE